MKNNTPKIVRLAKDDIVLFQKLIKVFNEVFETGIDVLPKKSYLTKLLSQPGFIVYVISIGDEVIGGLTAYELPLYYTQHSEVFIYDIAIKPQFQRHGLGKKLISAIKSYCKKIGIKLLFVAAEEKDFYAIDFYHFTGGLAEKVVHFSYPLL